MPMWTTKILPKVNLIVVGLSIIICIIYSGIYYQQQDHVMTIMSIVSIFLPILIYIVPKLWKQKLPETIKFAYVVFVFISATLGGVADFYGSIYLFDKAVHFISGLLVAWLFTGVFINYYKHKKYNSWFYALSLTCVNTTVACFWEVGEFLFGMISGKQVQFGLTDTMLDMIAAIIGGLIIMIIYIIKFKRVGIK